MMSLIETASARESAVSAEVGWRDKVAQQKLRLQSLRDQARERYAGGAPGLQVAALICQTTDDLVRELFEAVLQPLEKPVAEAVRQQLAIVAVGGTGRGELAPYSDVDLFFLHAPHCEPALAEGVAQFVRDCWDAGIKLGHSVRTSRDALASARVDPQFATSLVESRLLWGNSRLFETFFGRFRRQIGRGHFPEFYKTVVEERQAERSQFGETERQLEPDVKRSPGGLRDIHLIRWIGFARYGTPDISLLRLEGALTREDEQALIEAQEFITRIRVDLHFAAGKAQEVLTREEQLRLAELHRVPGTAGQRPVERFMQSCFGHSTAVADIALRFVERHRPRSIAARFWKFVGSHRSNDDFLVDADEIDVAPGRRDRVGATLESQLQIIELAAQYSVSLAPGLVELIRQKSPKLPRTVVPQAARSFLSILRATGQVGRQLRAMYRTGVLEAVLPEMAHVRCLLQFNQYHAYTVDEHSIRAVEAAERFEGDAGPLGIAYRTIRHRDLLHLALLLHDLGKGYERDHSEVGREIAATVAARLQLPPQQAEMVVFLVHKHLLMAHLAFRRDLSDEQMLVRFARDVGSPELLRMLFVLTASDMSAVGPTTWTGWKAELLTELYEGAQQILSGAPPKFRAAERVRDVSDRVRTLLEQPERLAARADGARVGMPGGAEPPSGAALELLDNELESLPLHYLAATPPEQIAVDLLTIRRLAPGEVHVDSKYESGTDTVEYRIITHDVVGSGLFHKITGVLTAKGLEILSANISTTSQRIVIDSFRVNDADHTGEVPPFRMRELESAIRVVLQGKMSVEQLFDRNRRLPRAEGPQACRGPTRVVVDNDSSERFTVIDVFANDRRGLLYTIASTLRGLGLSVSLAKISTHIDQVLDVFYVTDREGRKLEDGDRLQEIRSVLQSRIESFEGAGISAAPVG